MTPTRISDCPDESALRRLACSVSTDEMEDTPDDARTLDDADLIHHIETCGHCQSLLEAYAVGEWQELHFLLSASPTTTLASVASQEPVSTGDLDFPSLPDFRIVRELGRGVASQVFLAEERSTSRLVALKLIPLAADNTAAQRSQWLAEVRAAASVEHQNVVRLYRVEETEGHFLLVFEFISGGTLRDWISIPASQLQVARVAQIIARAVHQIHQRNILHLDLKPSNILIDVSEGRTWDDFVPKVSDFGIATGPHTPLDGSQTLLVRGTPAYMAPEQLLGDPSLLTPATDVYGLGGVIYCMLAGRAPMPEQVDEFTADRCFSEQVISPHDLDPAIDRPLSNIIMRCLSKQPNQRYPRPAEVADALQRWIEQQTHQPRLTTVTRGIRRRSLVWILPAILGCVALWMLVGPKFFSRENSRPDADTAAGFDVSGSSTPISLQNAVQQMLEESAPSTPVQSDVESLIRELSELPPAFSIDRAVRLVVSNRRFSDHLLAQKPLPIDECLRFGTLQQAAGIRFDQAGLSELYSATRFLAEDAIRLFAAVVDQQPNDQIALEKLIATRTLLSSIRIDKGQQSIKAVQQHLLSTTSGLRDTLPLITRLNAPRQRIYWAGMLLDTYRSQCWNSQLSGDTEATATLTAWELEAWQILAADHAVPDLAFRHSLMRFDVDSPDWGTVSETPWILNENKQNLLQESASLFLFYHFFNVAKQIAGTPADAANQTDSDSARWTAVVKATENYLEQRKLQDLKAPRLAHEDLIRPLTTFCTRLRSDGQLQKAEHLQKCYLELCNALLQKYPESSDAHLALSEAHLQAWKNFLRRALPDAAVASLRASLREAQIATELSPTSVRARDQVADRIKRLARFETSQTHANNSPSSQASQPPASRSM